MTEKFFNIKFHPQLWAVIQHGSCEYPKRRVGASYSVVSLKQLRFGKLSSS